MLEMNPERSLETGPVISFEMPAHEMCVERKAVLRRVDGQSEWMTFAIDFMPDKILINGRKFVYEGVADGRGFYREEPKDNRERRSSELLEPIRQMAQGFISAALAVRGVDEAYKSRETLERVGTNNLRPRPGSMAESIEFETNYCFGAEQVLENSQDSGPESHTTASPCDDMPCSRCSEVLDLVSKMIENPPGLSGIQSPLGHIGNQYVDAGWVEALTRVKARLVAGGSGTGEEV